MKVILATSTSPFVYGGATLLFEWLEEAFKQRGHEVETYRIPVYSSPADLPGQMVGLRMWDFTGHGDRLITIRTPSYMIRHHNKVAWFLHHHRPVYDLWDHYPDVPHDAGGREFRRMMFASDDRALAECERVFVNSQRVGDRLMTYNGISSEVLYPPLGASAQVDTGDLGDAIVYVSRIVPHKRQLLAVQALAHTRTPVRLVLAGQDGGSGYAAEIFRAIDELGLLSRVTFVHTEISDASKRDLLASALGVAYIPLDEDSYGFVGLEAAAARKALVTTSDSGGVLELVQDGVNGLVAEPDPVSLARAFDRLYEDRAAALAMGAALWRRTNELNISWDHVVSRLLA